MRRHALRLLLAALLLALVIEGPRLLWQWQDARTLNLLIVDKSVPFRLYREHASIPWLLRALKIQNPNGRFMDEARDYIGFDPVERKGQTLTPDHLREADVVYVADTYGVYVGDYEHPGDVAALERSPKIYGGLDASEANALKTYAERGGLLIAEFNAFASPTEDDVRAELEKLFGIRWTHWVARYWENIQDENEVPKWVGRLYERVYKRRFDLEGPAFVFVHEDSDMVVLRPGEHLDDRMLTIERTDQRPELFTGIRGDVQFVHWLDVVECSDCEVLYSYRMLTTPQGAWELHAHQVPAVFPALVRRKGDLSVYYLAGDMVDNAIDKGDPERGWILPWNRYTSPALSSNPDEQFFWRWFAPVFESLVTPRTRR